MKKLTKHNCVFIFLIIIFVSLGFIQAQNMFPPCPYGHNSVKKIRVLYGEVIMTSEIEKKVQNKEIILGGCIHTTDDPDYKVMCTKCDYELTATDGKEIWSRTSIDKNSFEIMLDNMTLLFPLVKINTEYGLLDYNQEFQNGTVTSEKVKYNTFCSLSEMEIVFNDFCKQYEIEIKETHITEWLIEFTGNKGDVKYEFSISNYFKDELIVASFSWSK